MRETGIGTSLILIAVGAVLAFAVNLQTTGVNLNTVGVILMLVGLVGLLFSLLAAGALFGSSERRTYVDDTHDHIVETSPMIEERTVETTESIDGERTVHRVRRARHL